MGSYEVVRKLARGGMADLFLARTVTDTFERLVVIKKILPKFADNPRFVQLFHDEAKLAAALKHKNIVEVFDIGGSGGESYFAMEYLHGQDVRSILHRAWKRNEKMPIKHAVQVAIQTASALHYAHEKRRPDGTLLNIVHRDVSPSNVIVAYDGATKLLDFGVAKAATSTIKTRTGTLKGKIAYMSPEQAKGGSVDRRSDIFSLGIMLWEMITTSRLFRGENDLATLQLIINEAPKKPSEVNPECPKDLERIVLRALAQDPNTRYQTALEFQQELEELVRQHQMVQSSNALGMFMSVLFQPEIASWKEAKAAGVELSEHLTTGGVAELTTPVSESEFIEPDVEEDDYDEDDDADEDDLAQAATSGTIQDDLDGDASATLQQTVEIHGGKRRPTSTPMPLVHVRQSEIPMPIGKQGSAPMVRPVLGVVNPPILPSSIIVRDQTPPPRAPTPQHGMVPLMQSLHAVSVPSPDTLPFSDAQAARLRKQFITVGTTVLGVIFLVAIIKACTGSDAPTSKAAVDPAVIEMKSTPPDPVVSPPSAPAPIVIDAAVAAPVIEPKPVPVPVAKPPIRKRPLPSTPPPKKPQDGRNKPFLR